MTAREAHDLISGLMERVAADNPEPRHDYTRGYLDCAAWLIEELEDRWGDEL